MSVPAYSEYQETGVQWLGQIPTTWATIPFGALFRRTKRVGFADEELLSVYRDYGVIRKSDRDDNFNNASEDLSTYQLVEPGDLAMNKMKAWQGSLGISAHRGIVSPAYFVFSPRREFHPQFLHHLLRSLPYAAGYMTISKGIRINQWDVDPAHLSTLPVLFPSFEEQAAIAAFLDRETATIDRLVAEQERLISLLKEKRQAVISHAVTKGLNPHASMKDSGIEWLGEIPAHWEAVPLKHFGTFNAGAGFPHEEQGVEGEDLTFYKVNALARANALDVLVDSEDTISRETAERLRAFIFPPGTIAFAKIGAALLLGRLRLTDRPACFDNNLMGLTVGVGNSVEFVKHSMSLIRFDYISNPGTVPSLNEGQIANAAIARPPLEEQLEIVQRLALETGKIDSLTAEAQSAIALLQERRAALISAAVTGKIDVRGLAAANDELEAA